MNKVAHFTLALATLCSTTVIAKENVGQNATSSTANKVAAGCSPTTAQTDMDINNIRTTIMTGGDMWWDLNTAKYEIPKGSKKHSMFAGALWIGGETDGGQLKVAAMTYRQTGDDFWAGPLDPATGAISPTECEEWDQHFKIERAQVEEFLEAKENGNTSYETPDVIKNWPARGSVLAGDRDIAPFHDVNNDGIYNHDDGDYPDYNISGDDIDAKLFGDQTLFWVFNDKGNVHGESGAEAIGLEIHAQAFAFATDDEINDMSFYNYKIINRATTKLNDTYFGQWVDPDLGYYLDDYVGCDVSRGLGLCYNGDAEDEGISGYGFNPPCIGVDFFEGPLADENDGIDNDRDGLIDEGTDGIDNDADGLIDGLDDDEREQIIMSKFVYYNNDFSTSGNPESGQHIYNYLRAIWKDNVPFTYGGNGKEGTDECDFMFPGDTDPNGWGVGGSIDNPVSMPAWSEETAGNTPADRRFLQSAGPFTLEPGAVNTITIGVIWARASAGGNLAAINLVKVFDDKAQSLFNNNFKVLDGPDAPDMDIVEMDKELVLVLSNDKRSNNYQESYKEKNPNITHTTDIFYEFQGYKVYQLADATVSASELDNPERARLIYQCDKEDGVDRIINQHYDISNEMWFPEIAVEGADAGISHTIRITDDQFATGNKRLVNHKTYHFMALSYAYNAAEINADPYAPTGSGQNKPYKQGRKNIQVYSAIPHITAPENLGTHLNAAYGDLLAITRVEGAGNGHFLLDFDAATKAAIVENNSAQRLTYKAGSAPVEVKVVDPTNVGSGSYSILFDHANEGAMWTVYDIAEDTVVARADHAYEMGEEKVIPQLGISIAIKQVTTPSYQSTDFVDPIIGSGANALTKETGLINATLTYADSSKAWLTGVSDRDELYNSTYNSWNYGYNWIRSGDYEHTFETDNGGNTIVTVLGDENDYQFSQDSDGQYLEGDAAEAFETILEGTWAPYKFTSAFHDGPALDKYINQFCNLNDLQSVDIVFTADQSKWTRCYVLEAQDELEMSVDATFKSLPRKSPSVGKDGLPDGTGEGMGWFPGYAVSLETGERLNMMFAEDTWLWEDNGNDMQWNPTSNELSELRPSYSYNSTDDAHVFNGGAYIFGGKHYVYVFNSPYDECEKYKPIFDYINLLNLNTTGGYNDMLDNASAIFRDAMWVGLPKLIPGKELLATDATVKIGVMKPFVELEEAVADTLTLASMAAVEGLRNNVEVLSIDPQVVGADTTYEVAVLTHLSPEYEFNLDPFTTQTNVLDTAKSALDLINVVPNPYYAYSEYETSQLDNRVKFTNLPGRCKIQIFTVAGEKVRTFDKSTEEITSLDWDLNNDYNIPVASGVYIIHVTAYDANGDAYGERVLKWFGFMRPIDLDTF
jgi:hypothetical protein